MTQRTHILIVEDEAVTRSLLSKTFTAEGFRISTAADGAQMRAALRGGDVDLMILDVNLPDSSGFDLAREIRASSDMGIIMLTARSEDVDRIVGLEIGADDYLTKPFNPRELAVRARNLLRRLRGPATVTSGRLRRFKDWTLDLGKRRLMATDGSVTALTPGEFGLLATLVERPGIALTRDQLMDGMGGSETAVTDRSVDVLIGRLRRKLGDNPKAPDYILTVPGVGYMFAESVQAA